MAPKKPERKRLFLPIPPDWDKMTDAEKDAAASAITTQMQRQMGITDESEQPTQTPDTREAVADNTGTHE